MERCVSRRVVILLLPLAVALAGCDMALHGHLIGRATDEWVRTYPLTAGGEVRIVNTNGKIDIEGTDGSTVEVRAERIARGTTDAAARELLPRIVIKEEKKPDLVSLETQRMSGIMFGAAFEVRYHVRAPKSAVINVTNTNGQVIDRKGETIAGLYCAGESMGGFAQHGLARCIIFGRVAARHAAKGSV